MGHQLAGLTQEAEGGAAKGAVAEEGGTYASQLPPLAEEGDQRSSTRSGQQVIELGDLSTASTTVANTATTSSFVVEEESQKGKKEVVVSERGPGSVMGEGEMREELERLRREVQELRKRQVLTNQ